MTPTDSDGLLKARRRQHLQRARNAEIITTDQMDKLFELFLLELADVRAHELDTVELGEG